MLWQQQQSGYTVRWLDSAEARRIEPRISDETLGATLTEGGGDVEPYRMVLALTRASERLGITVRHGRVIGLRREGGLPSGLAERLARAQVFVSVRGNALRVTPHLYNHEADLDRLISVLSD